MPRPKGYGRAARAASDAAKQERMVVGDTSAAPKKKGSPAKRGAQPGASARRKAKVAAAPKTMVSASTPTVSDWSQAFGLLMHACGPATRTEVSRRASDLAASAKSQQRSAALRAMAVAAVKQEHRT